MKKIVLASVIILGSSVAAFSQCDKNVVLTSSLTEYLDSNNVVQQSVPEKTTVKIDKSTITIAPGDNHEMKGAISNNVCNWTVPYKDGKSVLKAAITDESGDTKHATINLEGKAGKIILTLEAEEMPGRKIRVNMDSFEEAK